MQKKTKIHEKFSTDNKKFYPLCYGFVNVGVYELVKSDIPVKEQFDKFSEGFPSIQVNFSAFRKRFNQIKENIESLGKPMWITNSMCYLHSQAFIGLISLIKKN